MLKLENISKYYHSNDTVAMGLRRVNLEFNIGEFIAVTGESGSGKSTLLNVISGLDTYEEGELFINNEETSYFSMTEWESYRRQYIGFVFQSYNIIDSYSVLENVMIALKLQGYDKETRKDRALELIESVGLSSHVHHKASKLSGGQKQRAVIARALAKDCPIIVCDEPTGNLDTESSNNIMNLLAEISKDKLVIVVTHNYDEVKDFATRRIRLFDGEVIEDKKLKKTEKREEKVELAPYKVSYWGLFTLSLRNLFRTPRRTIFTTIIFTFIVAIFTFVYGNYVNILNEELGNNYNSTFENANQKRIIITKYDYTEFTDEELDSINGINGITYLNLHDVVNDFKVITYSNNEEGYLNNSEFFINPAASISRNELKEGRLPESKYEIVVESNSEFTIGDSVNYAIKWLNLWDATTQEIIDATTQLTVVGVTEPRLAYWSEHFYFHEDFIEDEALIQSSYYDNWQIEGVRLLFSVNPIVDNEYGPGQFNIYGDFVIDNTLGDWEFSVNYNYLDGEFKYYYAEQNGISYDNLDTITEQMLLDIDIMFVSLNPFGNKVNDADIIRTHTDDLYETTYRLNQATYDEIMDSNLYQLSAHTVDRFDALKVIDDLEALGFNAIYPTNAVSPMSRIGVVIQSLVFGTFMVMLMFGTYFIVYLILKNIQVSKKKDYLILRSIGASKGNLNKVTVMELFISMMTSYALVYLVLQLQARFNFIPYIGNTLKYFTIGNYVFLSVLLVYLTYILGTRFNKRIFNRSVITALGQE